MSRQSYRRIVGSSLAHSAQERNKNKSRAHPSQAINKFCTGSATLLYYDKLVQSCTIALVMKAGAHLIRNPLWGSIVCAARLVTILWVIIILAASSPFTKQKHTQHLDVNNHARQQETRAEQQSERVPKWWRSSFLLSASHGTPPRHTHTHTSPPTKLRISDAPWKWT